MKTLSAAAIGALIGISLCSGGCAGSGDWLASSGPSKRQITGSAANSSPQIPVVEITPPVVQRIATTEHEQLFSAALGAGAPPSARVRWA